MHVRKVIPFYLNDPVLQFSKTGYQTEGKKGNNSIMHIGSIMVFGGILEGVWPIYNQKKFLCVTSDARVKVE